MRLLKGYYSLARFNKPVGIALLWFPTAWALWAANKGQPPLHLCVLFFLGTLFMRSAGCVINDMADRNIDCHVQRTKLRPLTSNVISFPEALFLLVLLLLCALVTLIMLPWACFFWAISAVLITLIYPFCKRFLEAPQVVLGCAFSMGIPMAYAASNAVIDSGTALLLLINFLWVVAYDTMYAMTDKEDDLKIGVKSTAIYFAGYDRVIIGCMQLLLHSLWFYWASINQGSLGFYLFWVSASGVLVYQQQLISKRLPQDCFKAFQLSVYYGALMWAALIWF